MWKALLKWKNWDGSRAKVAKIDCRTIKWFRAIPKAWMKAKRSLSMGPIHTFAAGLRVPKAYGDYIILDILRNRAERRSPSLKEIMQAVRAWPGGSLFERRKGAASLAAYRKLRKTGF